MKKSVLQKYARAIAVMGANVQKGQEVVINCDLDQPEFIKMLAEECYRAGAKRVRVEWSYQPLTKVTYRHATYTTLSKIADWEKAKLEYNAEVLPAVIHILSEDPDGLKGIDQKKVSKVSQARYPIIKPIRDKMDNHHQWCIAAVPSVAWAKKVFPGVRASTAVEMLWKAILSTARADGDDPVQAWKDHNEDFKKRCDYLNSLEAVELRYKLSNGTDLKVGLIPEALFIGGSERTIEGVEYNPNMPTEEIFTSPMKGKAEGTVVSTMPLSYRGELIENFSITFKDGKAVDCKAEKNEELLCKMITMDENAGYLGECALVPYDSPIRNSGITFYNTLFDENACCHLALGMGFNNCLRDYDKKTLEECREMGINDSIIHVDFMIGSADLSIDAIGKDGKTYPIFRDGNWSPAESTAGAAQ